MQMDYVLKPRYKKSKEKKKDKDGSVKSLLLLLLLVTPNNQFLTMTLRRCQETARKMMKLSEVKTYMDVNDDEV